MTLRMIAKDLYAFQKEVERLEKALEKALSEEHAEIQERLRKARAERDRLQRMLDGAKEPPAYRKAR